MQFDGYAAITTSNWKQLKEMAVCCRSNKTGAVAVMGLVAAVWSNSLRI